MATLIKKTVTVTLIMAAATVSTGSAQDVATGQATANVLASLQVTATQDLNFGNVFQGVAKSVGNNDDVNSGIFQIVGANSAGISIYITLPAYIALASGADRMTIAFPSTSCTVDTMATTPSTVVAADGWINVDPNNLILPPGGVVGLGGQTNIYLGGRVVPNVDQAAGAYSGSIIVNVAYTGA
jgi:hypothetical protein